jgi:hypothetical protein
MVPPQLGRILGMQDQEGPSQEDLRDILAHLEDLSGKTQCLLKERQELDLLKARQAERGNAPEHIRQLRETLATLQKSQGR